MHKFEKQLLEESQLRAHTKVTYKTYLNRVRQFHNYINKPLEQVYLSEIREYFLHLINVKKIGRESLRNSFYAVRFYFVYCLNFNKEDFWFINVRRDQKIPTILSQKEVRDIISEVKVLDYRICLKLIYACGLRIGEAVKIEIADIDGYRKILTVRSGKGNKDRAVPIPEKMLMILRKYWKTHQNQKLLFPKRKSKNKIEFDRLKTENHIAMRTVQNAMKFALQETNITKKATPHTLRHSFATHLLEEGINLRALQSYLGHKTLRATQIYIHLTKNSEIQSYNILNKLMADL
ncbi:MAG: tyrosine-type recombinase/integrase [Candidatus Cloacimonadota bacterium]|nr:tyrosine-type recombinase/integrase [Candidatus Cloacimonadota bacterium]